MGNPIQLAACFRKGPCTIGVSWKTGPSKIQFVVQEGEEQQVAFSVYRGCTSTESSNCFTASIVKGLGAEGFIPEGKAGDTIKLHAGDTIKLPQASNRSGPCRKNDTPWSVILEHTRYTQADAAAKLGMSTSTLKAICRQHGLGRWPHRLMASALKRTCLPTSSSAS